MAQYRASEEVWVCVKKGILCHTETDIFIYLFMRCFILPVFVSSILVQTNLQIIGHQMPESPLLELFTAHSILDLLLVTPH